MTKKIALTKLENDQDEVGIQLRDAAPVTQKEGRLYVDRNSGEMKGFLNNRDVHLSFDMYENDPVTPAEKQVWINKGTSELKWRMDGVTKGISLSDGANIADIRSSSFYLSTLNDEELGSIADISTTFPSYLIDAFNGNTEGSTLNNLEVKSSSLSVESGETSGTYEIEKQRSSGHNYVEGAAVVKSQALKPKSITDNANGTHDVVFVGDVTNLLDVGQKVLAMEIVDGLELHLLDGDLNPSLLLIDGVVHNVSNFETTVTINDNELDLTFNGSDVNNLRFKPLNIKIEAGANGLGGNLTELEIVEAEALDSLSSVLGDDQIKQITTGLNNEKVYNVTFNKSENKQNWIFMLMVTSTDIGKTSGTAYIWKSTDGLASLEFVKGFSAPTTASGNDGNLGYSNYHGYAGHRTVHNDHILVHDDGRYLFAVSRYHQNNYHAYFAWMGNLNSSDLPRLLSDSYGTSYSGQLGMDSTNHYYDANILIDWDDNILAVQTKHHGHDPYIQIMRVNFTNFTVQKHGYMHHGTDYGDTTEPSMFFMKEFEGEKQIVYVNPHTNEVIYGLKFRYARFFADIDAGNLPTFNAGSEANISSTVSPYDGDKYAGSLFSNSVEGGNRFEDNGFALCDSHQYRRLYSWGWDEESDSLVVLLPDVNNDYLNISVTNFGRTRYGKTNKTTISFDNTPDAGNFTLSVYDLDTNTTEITSPFAFSNTPAQLQSVLEALTFVGSGNCTVTGSLTTGFEINFNVQNMRKEINITLNSQSMNQGGTATVITLTEVESGEKPIWLRHTHKTVNTSANSDVNGYDIRLDTEFKTNVDYVDGGAHALSTSMFLARRQSLIVKNKTILISIDGQHTQNDHDTFMPIFIKIPDYTQCWGMGDMSILNTSAVSGNGSKISYAGSGSPSASYLGHKSLNSLDVTRRGTRFAQKWNTGVDANSLYADGKIPVRTMMLMLSQYFQTSSESVIHTYSKPDHLVRMRLLPVGTGGKPDWDNPIAISTKRRYSNIPTTDDQKWEQFTFDDVRLDQNTDYFIGVEMLGMDLETDTPNKAEEHCSLKALGRTVSTTDTFYIYDGDGNWNSIGNFEMYFKTYDYYNNKAYALHEGGVNPNIRTYYPQWHDARAVMGSSIGERSDGKYLGFYRQGFRIENHYTDFSPTHAGSTPYGYLIEDTNGQFKLPTFRDPEVMGGMENWDKNLVFAAIFGAEDDHSLRLNQDGSRFKYTVGEDDYDHNKASHYGSFGISQDGNLLRKIKWTGSNHGVEEDSRFKYGVCTNFNGAGKIYVYRTTRYLTPAQHDFILEFEYDVNASDLDSTHNILFSMSGAFHIGIANNRLYTYLWINGAARGCYASPVLVEGYQRIRMTRDWENGIKYFRNYSKEGGVWEEMGTTGYDGSEIGSFFSKGAMISTASHNYSYITLGGYDVNTSHNMFGKLGYIKMGVGSSSFTYDGVNVNQKAIYRVRNEGDFITALQDFNVAHIPKYLHGKAKGVMIKHGVESSLVESKHTAIKIKGSVEAGRDIATKITLDKVSDSDPSGLEGYAVSFSKK